MKKTPKKAQAPAKAGGPYVVGMSYLFRGVTLYQIGTVRAVHEHEIVLDPAAWVADTGRFNEALRSGVLSEVEPFPDGCIVGRGAIMDAAPWPHGVPEVVK